MQLQLLTVDDLIKILKTLPGDKTIFIQLEGGNLYRPSNEIHYDSDEDEVIINAYD